MRFEDIRAWKFSYSLKELNYKGELLTNKILQKEDNGAILELRLFFKGFNAKDQFLAVFPLLKDVTFETATRDYECKLLGVQIVERGLMLVEFVLSYHCQYWGIWKEIAWENEAQKEVLIDSPMDTPIVIEVIPTKSVFKINDVAFKGTPNKKAIIDSHAIRIEGCEVARDFNLFYWSGLVDVKLDGIKSIRLRYRGAYALD